ncbi:MAG: bifunctional tetrahydrofolate synthase/dihydrofolate synthase [Candidatus Thiodiazotropha sp.]
MRFTTLDQWLDWQSGLHPSEIALGLERVAEVWHRLSPGGLASRVVTVAGTNGKGSCVAMLDAVCRRAGYRVATYTSPHLVRYNERIRLNGEPVADQPLCEAFDAVDRARGETTLTYFEFGTLAALYLFAQSAPDLVILEVGLGGRLDAVNVVDADLAIITTIDIDHEDWLGRDREAIGREKAGVMRRDRPVILADPVMPESVFHEAGRIGSEVLSAERDFFSRETSQGWRWSGPDGIVFELPMPGLRGAPQRRNAAAVVMACQCLRPLLDIPEAALGEALAQVRLPGRQQLLPGQPQLLLDVAHNRQAVEWLAASIDEIAPRGRVLAVFGLLQDKEVAGIARILQERVEEWHLMDLPGSRGRSAEKLAQALKAAAVGSPIHAWPDFGQAFQGARSSAREDDLIVVFGSFLVVGEAMHYLGIE